jgi:hypothetical protein
LFAVAEEHVSVDVPEPPVMLVGLRAHVRPEDGLLVRATVPVKPLTGATVIVTGPEEPALTTTLVELAVIVKSTTLTVMVPVVWERVPLIPVTVTVYVPALTVSVDVPEPVTLVGLSVAVKPDDGLAVRLTVPLNPLIEATVMVDVPLAPALTVTLVGLAVMLKSWTVKVTVAE